MSRNHGLSGVNRIGLSTLVAAVVATSTGTAAAQVTVANGNSLISFDPLTVSVPFGDSGGLQEWRTDSVGYIFEQSYYYRIGDAPRESHLATLPLVSQGSIGDSVVNASYAGSELGVDLSYTLLGGEAGSGSSILRSSVVLTNQSSLEPLELSWFEYTDPDLPPSFFDNTVSGGVDGFTIRGVGGANSLSFSPASVTPDAFQASNANPFQFLRSSLRDDAITDLDPTLTAVPPEAESLPLDYDVAFQWDLTIPADGSVTIERTMTTDESGPNVAVLTGDTSGEPVLDFQEVPSFAFGPFEAVQFQVDTAGDYFFNLMVDFPGVNSPSDPFSGLALVFEGEFDPETAEDVNNIIASTGSTPTLEDALPRFIALQPGVDYYLVVTGIDAEVSFGPWVTNFWGPAGAKLRVVPEPGAIPCALLGLLATAGGWRRRSL